jgi:tetratricopeptide (TPR) repeat protein
MVDQLTEKIKNDLNVSLEMAEANKGIAELSTNSLEAWRYYTDGVENLNKLFYKDAIAQLNKAIAIDSNFVSAYLRLMHGYGQDGMVKESFQIYEKLQQLKAHATEQDLYYLALMDASLKGDLQAMMVAHESWLKKYPPEKKVYLTKSYIVNLSTISWQHHDDGMKDGDINLAALCQKSDMAVAYGLIYLKSPDQRAAQLRMGADDNILEVPAPASGDPIRLLKDCFIIFWGSYRGLSV